MEQLQTTPGKSVIAFVNASSGGGQGVKILEELRGLLGEDNCYDLKSDGGPLKGLLFWKEKLNGSGENLIVIAGGGDGTVGWILTVLDSTDFNPKPAVVPLPLGTANDMSRVLKWGKGYAGESLKDFVSKIAYRSTIVRLDRWEVIIDPLQPDEIAEYKKKCDTTHEDSDEEQQHGQDANLSPRDPSSSEPTIITSTQQGPFGARPLGPRDSQPRVQTTPRGSSDCSEKEENYLPLDSVFEMTTEEKRAKLSKSKIKTEMRKDKHPLVASAPTRPLAPAPNLKPTTPIITVGQKKRFIANNYFSIGIDGKILLDFETMRKNHPELFPHRAINYGWYGLIGFKSMLEKTPSLCKFVVLKVDNHIVPIPKGVKALVCLNVPSYSGGTNPWKTSRNTVDIEEKKPQSICDGTLEIFGMLGAAHFARTVSQMSRGGLRICQGDTVEIILTEMISGQVDGEAHLFAPSKITVSCLKDKANMLFCTFNDPDNIKKNKLIGSL